jgi:ornithine cyclodeaminase
MVRFVDVSHMQAWIRSEGVRPLIRQLVTYLEDDFRRWNEFDKVSRVAAHSPDGVIELMPAADRELYGFKYVNGHPENPSLGLQTVTAFGGLSSDDVKPPVLTVGI